MNMLLNYQPRTNFQHHQPKYSQQQQQQAQVLYPAQLDFGLAFDDSHDLASASPSLSSSPLSQYSIVSPSALSGVGALPAISVPRDVGASIGIDDAQVNLSEPPELMQSETWFGGHLGTKSGRSHHQRESSLSSLGSAGPASPFNPTISNPHIAVTDPGSDGFHDVHAVHDNSWHYHAMPKPLAQHQDHLFPGYQAYGTGFDSASTSDVGFSRPRSERGILLPPADPQGATSRSHPGSVASSTFGGDSPATPSLGEPDMDERRRRVGKGYIWSDKASNLDSLFSNNTGFTNVPKLDRTMTDVYGDELYSPSFAITSAPPSNQAHVAISPTNELFAQRLQAANSQHLSATHSPISATSSDRSPFRQGSPFAPTLGHDFGSGLPSRFPPTAAQRSREQNAIVGNRNAVKRHQAGEHGAAPQTISPKDAVLEFTEADGDANFPLFPPEDTTNYNNSVGQLSKAIGPDADYQRTSGGDARYQYLPSQLPTGIQVPQQYPFIARAQPSQGSTPRLVSEPSSSESSVTPTSAQKPTGVSADGGTYTCTYHGCTLRFETPALLQKHKREGHRQAHGLNTVRRGDNGAAPGALGSQAGPHRCDRINPSTGKPCNTIFSRPYDLTRHEDTIHNARKQKVRCDMCTEEKTFSRADALTRHYRVCHPDVEFPGKHRRRGGQTG